MRRLLRTTVRVIGGTLLAILIVWAGSMAAVIVWSEMDQARPADSIVVLGAAQYDGRPSPVLRARLDHGIELWEKKLAKFLILTGGQGYGDTTTEAAVGKTYAHRHGVPDSAILL